MKFCQLLLLCIAGLVLGCSTNVALLPNPPAARRDPVRTSIHGYTRTDPYYWLREKGNPRVLKYLADENAYTDKILAPHEAFREKLFHEISDRISEVDVDVPHQVGSYWYYTRTEKGQQYPISCRKPSLDGVEQITLNLNNLSKTQAYVGLGEYEPTESGNLLAYSIDATGFRDYTLYIKDLQNDKLLPDTVKGVTSFAWAADEKTYFYTTENDSKRTDKVWRNTLSGKPELIYEETDEQFDVGVAKTRSGKFILIQSTSYGQSDCRYIPADAPNTEAKLIAPRKAGHEYNVDQRGDDFYILTNDKGRNFRLCTAPISNPDPSNWTEIIPHRSDVMIESIDLFKDHIVLSERMNGMTQLALLDPTTHIESPIKFAEPIYTVAMGVNDVWDAKTLRFTYTSLITPDTTYEYDFATAQLKMLKQRKVVGGYDPGKYEMKRIYAKAKDGAAIPISLVYRKDYAGKTNAMLLDGYGAYGLPEWPYFSSANLSLLDRGVTFAIAHIRGGGELGKVWHDQGRMMNKKNTFSDFIASAEYLIQQKYTSTDQLAIQGASAGGMLMGAVLNQRPDLFKCALVGVPFVDVMNTMLDDSLPLTTQEYLEWGNPNEKAAYDYMMTYSPYDNIRSQDYPSMLVYTSYNDSQVMYWEPTKYVAKLRALKTNDTPLLLHCEMNAGHGGPSGRDNELRDIAFQYAFVLWQLGIEK